MEGSGGGTSAPPKKEESLPPGFRFHPTDEELITYYLRHKIADGSFTARAIAEVDLNKCEPWDLPEKAKMGEKEWYFFSLRDRKYPTGVRTNRATNAGYWKTTGKDKEIFTGQLPAATPELVGMKKTLVFYKGRAPRGEKTNWVIHEYRIHSKPIPKSNKDEWVVCRVFAKTPGVKKYPSNNVHSRSHHPYTLDMVPPLLPTLLQQDPFGYMAHANLAELSRFARGTPGLHPHIQPHPSSYINPAATTPFAVLSGLNLNLGSSPAMPPAPQQHTLQTMPMSMMMNQSGTTCNNQIIMATTEQMVPGLTNGGVSIPPGAAADDGGFNTRDVVVGGNGIKYQNLEVDQLMERYWSGSY
ncbi:hypothetical protein GUJ93_ZPchr0002g22935 [Zizania palustris]|uniref:NAC domain-containing protein n=1 Tax=Zizania palustris TaxID=103762 RepID=A0A8J5RDN3_ZIZPA|nr:hypothetical protein GUJ93_ZPchr0002g22935 [Zizania palustris]